MSKSTRNKAERFLRHLEPLRGKLAAFCRRSLRNQNDVTDTLQSAVVTAFRDFDLYVEGTNFRAWMFRIVSHEILNRNRAATRHPEARLPRDLADRQVYQELLPEDSLAQRLIEAPEFVLDHCDDALSSAIQSLSEAEKSVFVLRAIGEFKYREIAEILEIPVGTVMSLLSRARSRLRRDLAEYASAQGLLPEDTGT